MHATFSPSKVGCLTSVHIATRQRMVHTAVEEESLSTVTSEESATAASTDAAASVDTDASTLEDSAQAYAPSASDDGCRPTSVSHAPEATAAQSARPHSIPNWELSEEELAAARKVEWPPFHGQKITMASFGCDESAQQLEAPAQRRVHESLVTKCDDLKAGDECLCLDPRDGQQWLATIKKITPHHVQVHYKGWSKSTDSWVTHDKLARKPSPHVLERIKQYNHHSKLKNSGTPKNQLSVAQRAGEPSSGWLHTGEALAAREMRSRLRGVEMYREASSRYPDGQWRAVTIVGNQKQYIPGIYPSKEEAHKAWLDRYSLSLLY